MDTISVFDQRLSCSSQALKITDTCAQTELECVAVLMSWTIKYTLSDQKNTNLFSVTHCSIFGSVISWQALWQRDLQHPLLRQSVLMQTLVLCSPVSVYFSVQWSCYRGDCSDWIISPECSPNYTLHLYKDTVLLIVSSSWEHYSLNG